MKLKILDLCKKRSEIAIRVEGNGNKENFMICNDKFIKFKYDIIA